MLEQALDVVLADEAIDAVIAIVVQTMAISAAEVRETITRVAQRSGKPVVACSVEAGAALVPSGAAQVAEIPSPERTAAALAHVCAYAQWRGARCCLPMSPKNGPTSRPQPDHRGQARQQPRRGLARARSGGLLAACGLPVLPTRGAATAAQAAAAAEAVGFPVVLKARSGDVVHQSDVGGVALGLADAEAVRAAYQTMEARLGARMGGAVIQPMAPPGVEAIAGLAADPRVRPRGDGRPRRRPDRPAARWRLCGPAARARRRRRHGRLAAGRAAAGRLTGVRRKQIARRSWRYSSRSPASPRKFPNSSSLDLNPILVSSAGAVAIDCKARLAPRQPGPGPLFPARCAVGRRF